MKVIDATFFDRPALKVAHDLLSCRLNWKDGDQSDARIITETKLTTGPDDLASHASKGRTKRNEAMFGLRASLDVECGHGASRVSRRCVD